MPELLNHITSEAYKTIITIIDDRVSEIKATRHDFDELKGVVRELAEAQKRTETRIEELTEAQKRTETRIEELTEAQKRTENSLEKLTAEVRSLTRSHKDLQKQVGGISHTIGYTLEDRSYHALPGLLKRDFGIEVKELKRRFLIYPDGGEDELNVYGEGLRSDRKVYIVGEGKAQLGRRDVDAFIRLLKRVRAFLGDEVVPVMVTYMAHPKVESYAAEKGLKVYLSYELLPPIQTDLF